MIQSYNSDHINPAEVLAFKHMVYKWFPIFALGLTERLALAQGLEEVAVEIRQSCAVDEAAKNQIS
jgi:hypothetical protein